jgi:hypothetical protein
MAMDEEVDAVVGLVVPIVVVVVVVAAAKRNRT